MPHPRKLPTSAAKNTKPVLVVLKLYGGDVKISEMVLNETIPAVQPNAYMKPAYHNISLPFVDIFIRI